jgi:hypothetical protein
MLHFDVRFDDRVGAVRTIIEKAVRSLSERDYNTIESIFPPFLPEQVRKIRLDVHADYHLRERPETVGVATHENCSATLFHCVAPRDDLNLTASIQTFCASVAALAVQCFSCSLLSWKGTSCLGRSLCLSIARDLYPDAVKVFEPIEQSWLAAWPLCDYVNNATPDARNSLANACVMLFFSFLRQMGFGWHQIVLAGLSFDSTPRDIYRTLTGDAVDPFPLFQQKISDELRR